MRTPTTKKPTLKELRRLIREDLTTTRRLYKKAKREDKLCDAMDLAATASTYRFVIDLIDGKVSF